MLLARIVPDVRTAPSYHRGPVALNVAGFQLARALAKHADVAVRRRPRTPLAEQLHRDGVVAIPSFLPDDVFAAVRAEYDASREQLPYERTGAFAEAVTAEQLVSARDLPPWAAGGSLDIRSNAERFPVTIEHVACNRTVADAVEAAGGRRVAGVPQIYVHALQRSFDADRSGIPPRGEYVFHADTHYPTFKAWLYLCDVDEGNGAFQYVVGSHRLTPDRLRYEYAASVAVAKARADGSYGTIPYEHVRQDRSGRIDTSRSRSMVGPANTLVIANTCGFHRRGDFTDDRVREMIEVSYRAAESIASRFPSLAARLQRSA